MSDSDRGERNEAVNTAFSISVAILLVAVIVGTLSFSQGVEVEKRQQSPAAYAESGKEAAQRSCSSSDAAAVFECVYEKVEASQEQARAEQDLNAQQGMKFWAAVMAILSGITAIITGFGVWYVKKTLETNEGFVKESRDATSAMIRQNDLAEAAQRPWVSIKLEIEKCETRKGVLTVGYRVVFKNIGKTIAENVRISVDAYVTGNDWKPLVFRMRESWSMPKGPSSSSLVPGETKIFRSQSSNRVSYFKWKGEGKRRHVNFIVACQGLYSVPGKPAFDDRRETFRTFRVGFERVEPFEEYMMFATDLEFSGPKDTVVHDTAPNIST